jgi:3-hydroxyisobutyrate dehydrogenase-like beta-hydroxyacid dehydrogenase
MEKIGVLGLGIMGFPMALNIKNAGYPLVGYDKNEYVLKRMKDAGIPAAENPCQFMKESDVILDILNSSEQLQYLLEGEDGLRKGINGKKVIFDFTTSDPEHSVSIGEKLEKLGVVYIDSAMTGGETGARNGELVLMVGGDKKEFETHKHILAVLAKSITYLGPMGSGHYMKLIHNQLSHSTFLASCEAVLLGKKLGLSVPAMIRAFNLGNARSHATEIRFPDYILSGTFHAGARFNTLAKDISLVMKHAKAVGYADKLSITKATHEYWQGALAQGKGDDDYSTIYLLMEHSLNT